MKKPQQTFAKVVSCWLAFLFWGCVISTWFLHETIKEPSLAWRNLNPSSTLSRTWTWILRTWSQESLTFAGPFLQIFCTGQMLSNMSVIETVTNLSCMQELPAAGSQLSWAHPGIQGSDKMLITWNPLAFVQSTVQTGKNHNLFQLSFQQYLSLHFL